MIRGACVAKEAGLCDHGARFVLDIPFCEESQGDCLWDRMLIMLSVKHVKHKNDHVG